MTHLALHATGIVPKRRLIPRQPPDRLLAEIETWIRAEYPDAVRTTETRTADGGVRELAVGLHPAATDVVIAAGDDGAFTVRAAFAPVGPGYQTFVGRLAQRIGTEHGIVWTTDAEADPAGGAAARTTRTATPSARRPRWRPARTRSATRRARPSARPPSTATWRGSAAGSSRPVRSGGAAPRRSTSGRRPVSSTRSTRRSRPRWGRATTPGSRPPSAIHGSRSTSRRGGPTRSTRGTS